MGELTTSIQYLSGVGPKRAELLRRELGVETLSDLIHLYPFRYIDRSGITPIAQIAPDLARSTGPTAPWSRRRRTPSTGARSSACP